jgi:tRNA(Ile)-lysidine synthase
VHPFVLKAQKTIEKHAMLQPGDRVVVGVSGGADSMALLYVLWELRRDLRLSLFVAHLDHGLRPEGPAEKSFVHKASRRLGVPFISQKGAVRAKQEQQRLTLEEAAREVRYSFLLETAQIHQATKIALGHTADDQAESIIMRLLRGSGTRGLGGIPPVRDKMFIRPLLESWREEVESFLREKKVAFLTDPSNRFPHFLRNRVRHELLPILQEYNPRLPQMLVQMAAIFRAEEEFWQTLVEEKFPLTVRSQNKISITLDIPSLIAQPLPLRLRSLRYATEKTLGNLRGVGLVHILAMNQLLQSPEPNQSLQLPQGLFLTKAYQALTFTQSREESPPFEVLVAGPGCWKIPAIGREMRFEILTSLPFVSRQDSPEVALLDYHKVAFPLIIRSFKAGDRLQPLGMEGEKKVKDLFIDCKIPTNQRKKIPLLFKKDQLLWIAGLRLDHRVRVRAKTQKILRVEFV